MTSKYYCPKCKSYKIQRIRRGFIKKRILKIAPQYLCTNCASGFTDKQFKANKLVKNSELFS